MQENTLGKGGREKKGPQTVYKGLSLQNEALYSETEIN